MKFYVVSALVTAFNFHTAIVGGFQEDPRTPDVQKQFLSYKRVTDNKADLDLLYKPIRIRTEYRDIYNELTIRSHDKLITTVHKAVNKISEFLKVFPLEQPMLLKRSGCFKEWTIGPNKGKCFSVKKYYQNEICGDSYRIPDNHLDGLSIWNQTYSEPLQEVFPRGPGINNTDFVLYVESMTTQSCGFSGTSSVLAYAKVCQVDQHDRPIAGYINLCPQELEKTSSQKLYMGMIHELFHTLGFSKDHLNYFKKCFIEDGNLECRPLNLVKVKEVSGTFRLVTPAVRREAQIHFGCYNETKFGAPLDRMYNTTSSHWDSRLMYGSIMAPSIGMPQFTFIDRITLAVFEDSGWYRVDYSHADTYMWGRGIGCSSRGEFCSVNEDSVCRNNSRGCHFLHKNKAWCEVDEHSICGIYHTNEGNDCTIQLETEYVEEIYGTSSACFVSNLTKENVDKNFITSGRCYQYSCSKDRNLKVKVQRSQWMECPFGNFINVPGYNGYIRCPSNKDIICPETHPFKTTTTFTERNTDNVIHYTTDVPRLNQKKNINETSSGSDLDLFDYLVSAMLIFLYVIK